MTRSRIASTLIGLGICITVGPASPLAGQEILIAPLESEQVAIDVDSGAVRNTGEKPDVVFRTVVAVPDALWLRLKFKKVALAGCAADGNAAFLRITSLADGGMQLLWAEHVSQWRQTSAYFNGDAMLVELIAYPGTGVNHLVMTEVTAGVRGGQPRSICGPTDDRVPSDDPRAGRAMPIGCTAWIIDDCNHCLLTAGHCIELGDTDVIEFNVPESNSDGSLNHPPPEDQYAVDQDSVQHTYGGVGNDWAYFGCFPNPITGLTPFEAQGDFFTVVEPYPVSGDIRVTGYGTTSYPIPPQWNQIQKTHAGPYWDFYGTTLQYQTDTTGGNSGSPVIYEDTGEAIGIHTHGGCSSDSGNAGTGANHPGLQAALASPTGVCIPSGLEFSYPNGLPELINPDGGTTVRVVVGPGDQFDPQPGTGQFHYDLGDGYVTVDMQEVSDNVYDAVFPAVDCATTVDYYFSAQANDGERYTDPPGTGGPPARPYTTVSGYGTLIVFADALDTSPGWNTQGLWAFGQPRGQGGEYGGPDPNSGYTGQNVYGYNLNGDYENYMPERHLTSGPIDCTGSNGVRLSFWRWLGVEQPAYDHAYVRVSNNGTTWTTVWQNGREITDSAWVYQEFDISAVADGQATVYLRWTMGSTDSSWRYCGWNIDDVQLFAIDCDASNKFVPNNAYAEPGKGHVLDGDVEKLAAQDGALWRQRAEVQLATVALESVLVAETNVGADTYASGQVKVVMNATPPRPDPVQYRVRAWTYAGAAWVTLGTGDMPADGSMLVLTLDVPGDVNDFIEAGTRQMRVDVQNLTNKVASGLLIHGIDLVRWELTP